VFSELVLAGEAIAMDVGLEVAWVDAQRPTEVDGGDAARANELVDEGAANVEDFGDFTEIEQTRLHAASSASRRQLYMEEDRRYCGRMRRLYRTRVLESRGGESTEWHGLQKIGDLARGVLSRSVGCSYRRAK
jgi:hypothetical protein